MIRVTECLPFNPQCDPETLEIASQRGTAGHLAAQISDLHKFFDGSALNMDTVDPEVLPYFKGWEKFLSETGFTPTHIELEITSEKYGYKGKLDRLGYFPDGRNAQAEIKTGVIHKPDTWGVQMAAYDNGFCEMEDIKHSPYERLAVQLTKEGTYKIHKYDDPKDFSIFLAYLTIRKWEGANS